MRDPRELVETVTDKVRDVADRVNLNENWRKYAMFGSFAAAAFLFFSNRRAAGFAAAGIGLAILGSEHPERFREAWDRAPEFLDKGQRVVQGVSRMIDQVTEQAGRFQNRGGRMRDEYLA